MKGWRLVALLVLLAGGGAVAATAEPEPVGTVAAVRAPDAAALQGRWVGNDRASEALYGTVQIRGRRIVWRGRSRAYPPCQTTFTVVSRQVTADSYPDNIQPPQPGRRYTVYRLQLAPRACVGRETLWQFALPDDAPGYAELVTYRDGADLSGWHNFSQTPTPAPRGK
jgi:hypothetical protein